MVCTPVRWLLPLGAHTVSSPVPYPHTLSAVRSPVLSPCCPGLLVHVTSQPIKFPPHLRGPRAVLGPALFHPNRGRTGARDAADGRGRPLALSRPGDSGAPRAATNPAAPRQSRRSSVPGRPLAPQGAPRAERPRALRPRPRAGSGSVKTSYMLTSPAAGLLRGPGGETPSGAPHLRGAARGKCRRRGAPTARTGNDPLGSRRFKAERRCPRPPAPRAHCRPPRRAPRPPRRRPR